MPRRSGPAEEGGEEEVEVAETHVVEEEVQISQTATADAPSMFKVSELISLSDKITEMPSHFAAGAMAHANRSKEDMIGIEEFKQLVEQYREIGAF